MKDNEEKLWILMKVYPRRTFWMAMLIMFLFASIFLILLPIGLIWFPNDSDRFGNFGLAAILSMMGIVYIINWVNCFRFIKKANDLRYKDLEEAFLKRLIKMYISSCFIFMVPFIFFVSIKGFGMVNRFAYKKIVIGAPHEKIYLYLMRE